VTRRRGGRRETAAPDPLAIYSGPALPEAEPELVARLAASPRLVRRGAFRLGEGMLAFPEAVADEVERELAAMGITPRRA
jgi:hypothetical protein